MEKCTVFFYFGSLVLNPFVAPIKVNVEVAEGTSDANVIIAGLKKYGKAYPRTYSAKVERVTS